MAIFNAKSFHMRYADMMTAKNLVSFIFIFKMQVATGTRFKFDGGLLARIDVEVSINLTCVIGRIINRMS